MRIGGYLGKLTRKMASESSKPDATEVVFEGGTAIPARIIEINEYGCALECWETHVPALAQSGSVRVRWENFAEGIRSTVMRCNEETGFVVVRFDDMSNMQYIQLRELIDERECAFPEFNEYGFKVS